MLGVIRAMGCLLASWLFVAQALGLCVSSTFERQVDEAKVIFVGTIRDERAIRTPETIYTRYRFDDVRYLKGAGPTDGLVLVELGGRIGTTEIGSEHQQRFRPKTRYAVLAGTSWASLPGSLSTMPCGVGPFGILPDSGSEIPTVHLSSGPAVAMFDRRHLVLVSKIPWSGGTAIAIDDDGTVHRNEPPPKRSLSEEIRASYSLESRIYVEDLRETPTSRYRLRTITLYPHQDPGTRIGEQELIAVLSEIIAERARLRGDSIDAR